MSPVTQYIFDGSRWRSENEPQAVAAMTTSTTQPWLELPADINRRTRKAFGHYFGPYPRSLDNAATRGQSYYVRQYLNRNGESGKHVAYGGWLRDAPVFRPQDTNTGWGYDDCVWDITTARAAGLDGFFVNIMSGSGNNWDRYIRLRDAAHTLNNGFLVVPMLDGNGGSAQTGPTYAAGRIAQFAHKNGSYNLTDGRFVVSCFKVEAKTADWWNQLFIALKSQYQLDAAMLAVALDYNALGRYASAIPKTWYLGEGKWEYGADPSIIRRTSNQVATSHTRGVKAMSPVIVQNARPYAGTYDEAGNTESARASWEKVIAEGADYVQLVTWSDFSEGSQIAPSEAKGSAALELSSWYLARWKTGSYPRILRDTVILSHRSNFAASKPSGPQTRYMTQGSSSYRGAPRDTVETITFLTAAATVTISVGSHQFSFLAPAGMSVHTVPLSVGRVKADVTRGSAIVVSATSATPWSSHRSATTSSTGGPWRAGRPRRPRRRRRRTEQPAPPPVVGRRDRERGPTVGPRRTTRQTRSRRRSRTVR